MENNVYKSLYHGDLNLCGYKISCAVLEDGTRVLVNRSLANTLGIKGGGHIGRKRKVMALCSQSIYQHNTYSLTYLSP